jgi:hypothetical protein
MIRLNPAFRFISGHCKTMFERNRIDNADQGFVTVELTTDGGLTMTGKIAMPAGRAVLEHLNGSANFLEFEAFDGDRRYLAKSALREVKQISVPRAANLNQRLRDLDGFDPYAILGVDRTATWEDTRAAFHRLAKIYHPDRYATAELPEEVKTYLYSMARRVNAAYAALEAMHDQRKQVAQLRQEPVYTTPARR